MKKKDLSKEIEQKAQRKIKARKSKDKSVWFGLGMFGIVGWSVAIPTLLGTALGIWIDSRKQGSYSWTLMLLFAGLILGCINAWYWIKEESKDD